MVKKKRISKKAQRDALKAQKVLDVLLEKGKCPHCKINLGGNSIGWTEHGDSVYTVGLEANRRLSFEQNEFMSDGDGLFYCRGCGEELNLSQKEVVEILKTKSNRHISSSVSRSIS